MFNPPSTETRITAPFRVPVYSGSSRNHAVVSRVWQSTMNKYNYDSGVLSNGQVRTGASDDETIIAHSVAAVSLRLFNPVSGTPPTGCHDDPSTGT